MRGSLRYATQFPQEPCGLILCNTEAKFSAKEREKAFNEIVGESAAKAAIAFDENPTDIHSVKNYVKYCLPNFSKNSYDQTEISRCIKNPIMRDKFLKEENNKFNYLPLLYKISCPTLVVAIMDPII